MNLKQTNIFFKISSAGFAMFLFYTLPFVFAYFFSEQLSKIISDFSTEKLLMFDGILQFIYLAITLILVGFVFKTKVLSIFKVRGICNECVSGKNEKKFFKYIAFGVPIIYAINIFFATIVGCFIKIIENNNINVPTDNIAIDNPNSVYSLILFIVRVCVFAPFIEEVLIRGVVLKALLPCGQWCAIITSSLMFGLIHGNLGQAIPATFAGITLGFIAVKTGSIYPCLILHMLNNCIATVGMLVQENGSIIYAKTFQIIMGIMLLCGIFFLVSVISIHIYKKTKKLSSTMFFEKNTEISLTERLKLIILNPFILAYFAINILGFIYSFFKIN